ncbi:hypothetical protein WMY93_011360 [Mugilogobius chulae]|uniref:Uncharacterized protein n=1 Tax=Mugilogobius chulae TaxID=88201 RepID=A0AAW0PCD4_9GOBI
MFSHEKELAEVALQDRGCVETLRGFRRNELSHRQGSQNSTEKCVNYERYGLIAVHRDLDSWLYVSQDPQFAVAVEEIVNTFSPALSLELLLHNVLGSNSESGTCLVRYLTNYYTSSVVCAHIKTTLRNMVHWAVLAGFIPSLFLPWKKLRALGLGLSGKAILYKLLSSSSHLSHSRGSTQDDDLPFRYSFSDEKTGDSADRHGCVRRVHSSHRGRVAHGDSRDNDNSLFRLSSKRNRSRTEASEIRIVPEGLSPPAAAYEALQEREAHEQALPSLLNVSIDQVPDMLQLLMTNSVPSSQVSVVCKILKDWIKRDSTLRQDPAKETELKMGIVALWGVIKTFEHGRCPVIPECRATTCIAFYDTETDLVTALVDKVLYKHISVWDSCWSSRGPFDLSTLAKRAHATVKSWATLFHRIVQGLTTAATRHVYTSTGADRSSLTHLADMVLASRGEQQRVGLSVAGNAFERPLLDNLSRFLATEQQPDMFGLNMSELPDIFLRSGVGTTVSEHKSASVSHSLSKMMTSMISEGKEVLLVRQFLGEVTRHPRAAFERLRGSCKDQGLLQMAACIVRQLEQSASDQARSSGQVPSEEPVTELGSDVRLVCNYQSTVSVAHLEETLSMWTNFWRSALSGFSQFSRRHNTIQYNNRDTVRELESGSPVHVFHCLLVSLLNTSGVNFADSLSGRKPDSSLTVNDIMLTRDSLHPTAYGLLLANKLGLRPSDVKCQDPTGEPVL